MTMLQFGEPEGNTVALDEKGETVTNRADLLSYETYLDGVEKKTEDAKKENKGFEARLPVNTGEPLVNRAGKTTGRGVEEWKHDRNFKTVAKMRGYSLTIVPEHTGTGTTILRIAIKSPRKFTDLTTARRDRGRINYQAEQARDKAALPTTSDREKAKLTKKAEDLFGEVADLDREIAELEAVLAAYAKKLGVDVEDLTTEDKFAAFANGTEPEAPKQQAPAKAAAPKAPAATNK